MSTSQEIAFPTIKKISRLTEQLHSTNLGVPQTSQARRMQFPRDSARKSTKVAAGLEVRCVIPVSLTYIRLTKTQSKPNLQTRFRLLVRSHSDRAISLRPDSRDTVCLVCWVQLLTSRRLFWSRLVSNTASLSLPLHSLHCLNRSAPPLNELRDSRIRTSVRSLRTTSRDVGRVRRSHFAIRRGSWLCLGFLLHGMMASRSWPSYNVNVCSLE